jgi:hypothetical protein
MAELNIVFRLRFAVGLAIVLTLLLAFHVRDASASMPRGTHEYIVQMDQGVSPSKGQRMAVKLGGVLSGPRIPVVNGFAALMNRGAATQLSHRVDEPPEGEEGGRCGQRLRALLPRGFNDEDDEPRA